MKILISISIIIAFSIGAVFCQEEGASEEQSRESMAVDATATQWSYQFAYEGFWNYKTDEIEPGVTRPEGRKGFFQFRWVAPIPKSDKMPITLLPRLTLRVQQAADGDFGFGASDIFILGIINQWSSGRWGIGPQINFPAQESKFGNPNWALGFAAAVTQRAWDDKLFFAFLVQQTWTKKDGKTKPSPLALNPSFVIQLGKGWYTGNGDYVISYDWDSNGWLIPLGVRVGKAFISEAKTWNAYLEYSTVAAHPGWKGPIPGNALRVNVQFQIPFKR